MLGFEKWGFDIREIQTTPAILSFAARSESSTEKGQRRSFEAKTSLRFLENSENELPSEDKNKEMITPQLNKPLVELNLNVDDLLSYQSTQVKVAIVNPSCHVDLQFNDSISAIWSSIILFSGETMIAQVDRVN